MGKRRRSETIIRREERRSNEIVAQARKLIKLRNKLTKLMDLQSTGNPLSDAQKLEAQSLVAAIRRIKAKLAKQKVDARLISSTERLSSQVKSAQQKRKHPVSRSGGVGIYSLGMSRKVWK